LQFVLKGIFWVTDRPYPFDINTDRQTHKHQGSVNNMDVSFSLCQLYYL
jgi:hypothetical protein